MSDYPAFEDKYEELEALLSDCSNEIEDLLVHAIAHVYYESSCLDREEELDIMIEMSSRLTKLHEFELRCEWPDSMGEPRAHRGLALLAALVAEMGAIR